jgi:hypothetical protein
MAPLTTPAKKECGVWLTFGLNTGKTDNWHQYQRRDPEGFVTI